jgi:hypothetical protein
MKKIALSILIFTGLIQPEFAQSIVENMAKRDTSFILKTPLTLNVSALMTTQLLGFRVGVEHALFQKEIQKLGQSGKVKTIKKDRLLSLDLGYYYQAGLHHNWFLTAAYKLKRTGNSGFYTEFSPFLGISRTFLTEETYSVDGNGITTLNSLAGDWYLTSGFGVGVGQTFSERKNFVLKDIHLSLFLQVLYPNFGSFALKPSFQLGTSVRLDKIQRLSKKTIKYKS